MDQDLLDLLVVFRGGDLPETRRAELLARLTADAEFRRPFTQEIRMLGMLKAVQSIEPRWLRLEDLLGWSAEERTDEAPLEDRVMQSIADLPRPRSSWRRYFGGLAATIVAGLLTLWASHAWRENLTPGVPPFVAVVVRLDGAHWNLTDGAPPTEGTPLPAGWLHLQTGRATLTFFSGVMLSVQGPADLNLLSVEQVFCQQGKLRARVPTGGRGFTVLAPGSALVDLGTEFGLNVANDGTAEFMVFEGKAEVSVLNAEGHTLRSQLLQEKMAAEVEPSAGRIRDIAGRPEHFVASPEMIAPELLLDPSYAEAVRALRPWGYWRFQSMSNQAIPNDVTDRPSLQAVGPVELTGPGDGNRSVRFASTPMEQFLVMDGSWTPPRQPGYALELWVLSEEINASTPLSLTSRADEPAQNHAILLELTGLSHHLLHNPCRVRYLDRWPPGGIGGVNVFSRHMYIPYRWHHLVAQQATDRLELYLDGQLDGTALADIEEAAKPCRLMVGRLKSGPQPDLYQVRPFIGRLDELVLYDHPLSPLEIRRHFELGTTVAARGESPN